VLPTLLTIVHICAPKCSLQTSLIGIIYLQYKLRHIPSVDTLAMSFYLSLYQPYLLPSPADASLSSQHQTSSLHVQTISIYCLTTSNTDPTFIRLNNSSDFSLLLSVTPHIHLNILELTKIEL